MKKIIVLLMSIFFLAGCSCRDRAQVTAVKINNYEISKAEFEQEFKDSSFAGMDSSQSRKDFLDNLVNRILILQDAQRKGLDKDPKFLKMIERFWMQSLLRLAIDKKSAELGNAASMPNNDKSKLMDAWVAQLHKEADIRISDDLISGK